MMNTSLHNHKSILRSTADLRDISMTPRSNSKRTGVEPRKQSGAFCLSFFLSPLPRPRTQTRLHAYLQKQFVFLCKKKRKIRSGFCLRMLAHDLLQGHLRFLLCSPRRSPRLDRCPAQVAAAGRAACVHPFLRPELTAAGTDKVVPQ